LEGVFYCLNCENLYRDIKYNAKIQYTDEEISELYQIAENTPKNPQGHYDWTKIKEKLPIGNKFKELTNVQLSKAYSDFKWIAQGICRECKKNKIREGIRFCDECAQKQVEIMKGYRRKIKAQTMSYERYLEKTFGGE